MKKTPLVSRSPQRRAAAQPPAAAPTDARRGATVAPAAEPADAAAGTAAPASRWRRAWTGAAARPLWGLSAALALLAAAIVWHGLHQGPGLDADALEARVRDGLVQEPLPSAAATAYEAIAPSVVRVVGLMGEEDEDDDKPEQRAMARSLGTGVVIQDNGTILTNLHVVAGARKVMVRFANGHQSEAVMVGARSSQDLAVLKALNLPDDLEAATMRSTADLRPGDHVIAVGHPFGIGPSVSYGVVSGLKRNFRSPDGQQMLSDLIQFDAAANPGNSGGPLVTMDGHVVGIVTAILNPNEQRTFVGIGFAVPIESAAQAAGMPPF